MRTLQIELHGKKYLWNGASWTNERFLRPPSKVRSKLMLCLVSQLQGSGDDQIDLGLVVRAAQACMDEGHLTEARGMAERVMEADPQHIGAVIVLGKVLRKQRLPRRAIRVTTPFQRRRNAELLTVRAAAYCDISEWGPAEKLVRRAIAIDKTEATPDTLQVLARVIAARARLVA